jgi:serine/threonine-protein kinase RsbW
MSSHTRRLESLEKPVCVRIRTAAEMTRVVDWLRDAMTQLGYTDQDVFAVRLALEEAVINAVKHGNRSDPNKQVRIRYQVTGERVVAEVEDQGAGFDPTTVADPLGAEGLLRTSGRGLHLMRCCMSSVRHNKRGNIVTLCKRRGEPQPVPA